MRLITGESDRRARCSLACAASSCGSMGPRGTSPGSTAAPVKSGAVGRPHIAMTVAASKTEVEFDCGKATVGGAIDADPDGGFAVPARSCRSVRSRPRLTRRRRGRCA